MGRYLPFFLCLLNCFNVVSGLYESSSSFRTLSPREKAEPYEPEPRNLISVAPLSILLILSLFISQNFFMLWIALKSPGFDVSFAFCNSFWNWFESMVSKSRLDSFMQDKY